MISSKERKLEQELCDAYAANGALLDDNESLRKENTILKEEIKELRKQIQEIKFQRANRNYFEG